MTRNRVAIVCGYDIHSDLRDYVRRFVPFLSRCDLVILSGGCTSSVSEESEAQALSVLVDHPNVILEEQSMTTLDNILFSRLMAEERGVVTHYVVICDRVHSAKVLVLSAILLRVHFTVRAVRRRVPLRVMLFEPISIVAEAFAAVFPVFRSALRRAAMRLKGVTARSGRSARRVTA
ncbi:MAG TPA: ElyC/SanA/YdcF family protein [Thermoanaerobaculia bacterium]